MDEHEPIGDEEENLQQNSNDLIPTWDLTDPRIGDSMQLLLKTAIKDNIPQNLAAKFNGNKKINWERNWKLLKRYYSSDDTFEDLAADSTLNLKTKDSAYTALLSTVREIHREFKLLYGRDNLPIEIQDFANIEIGKKNLKLSRVDALKEKTPLIQTMLNEMVFPDEIFRILTLTRKEYESIRNNQKKSSSKNKINIPKIYSPTQWAIKCLMQKSDTDKLIEVTNYITKKNSTSLYVSLDRVGLFTSLEETLLQANIKAPKNTDYFKNVVEYLGEKNIPVGYVSYISGTKANSRTYNYYFVPTIIIEYASTALGHYVYRPNNVSFDPYLEG
jgi:hypothetical protein